MARFPKHVNIVARLDPNKPDGVDFHMERPNGDKLETIVFSKDDEKMAKTDEHEVHFTLDQKPGMTLEFAQSLTDVLWVAWGDHEDQPPCPKTRPPNCPDPVFFAEKSSPKRLTAVNTNPEKRFFSFTINFVDRTATGPQKLIPYDPIGDNKNGGSDGTVSEAKKLAILIGVTIVLALGYVLLA